MKIFETLQELINYIPHCVICGKEMKLSIEGYVTPVSPSKPKFGKGSQRVYLKLELKDDILRCKQDSLNLAIEAATNKLIDGEELVNRLMLHTINVKKCCPTCVFKSVSVYGAGHTKKTHCFPPLTLQSEELNYTMRGGKRCLITKHYLSTNSSDEEANCVIWFDRVPLQPIPLDFSKLTSLEQLNKKIKTIVVFQ